MICVIVSPDRRKVQPVSVYQAEMGWFLSPLRLRSLITIVQLFDRLLVPLSDSLQFGLFIP